MRRALPWLLLAALLAFLAWKLSTSHFDWAGLTAAIRRADPGWLALGTLLIYSNNLTRALRWRLFLGPAYRQTGIRPTPWYGLIGAQFMGFTALALFGRVGELIRPVLIARRTGLTVSSQIAVVAVERIFDLGAFASLFALNLLLAPGLNALPYHELFQRVGLGIAGIGLALGGFVLAVRLAGNRVAHGCERVLGAFSQRAGAAAAEKILAFRAGLDVIASPAAFAGIVALSLVLWLSIGFAYLAILHGFPPPIHALSLADCLLLLGFSVVGGVVQLPGIGGGSQVLVIVALTRLFSIPVELATGAGLVVWLIGSWSIVPAGLIYARIDGVSLRQPAAETKTKAERNVR